MQRQMNIDSKPSGALVYLNDREIGRTPFKKDFLWYGNYDVVIRKDGYQTLKTNAEITAPFWQWVPFDAITDFLPLHDEEHFEFTLKPEQPVNASAVVARGEQMQQDLESSQHTVQRTVIDVAHPARSTTTQITTTQPATTNSATQPD